jgi:single-stranded-DNA-specific exonuclease
VLRLPPPTSDDARALARELAVSRTVSAILLRRGHADPLAATRFLDPKLANLTSPLSMRDRKEAASRLARAVRAKEPICVFGDYDADGVTSAALLTDVLRALGGEVTTLLADRFHGGYGLSGEALARVFATGATLLVTCDCGTSDHERLADARRRGVDVIVIDHHRVPDEPLPALAFLNPHRPECGFPFKGLASVGLALSIAAGVRAELGATLDLRRWLDLVALGTIADVVPLDGDNRPLVRVGLGALGRGARPGVRALTHVLGYGAVPVTGEAVSFRYAPRINAPGRLAKPDLALRLLLATSDGEARALALEIDALCEQRKAMDRALMAEALEQLLDASLADLPVIVLGKQGWHQGIVGIAAGRLASRFGKPTIVIGFDGATGRGSVRGPPGFHLYDALAQCSSALLGFGGHQAAAGVHVAYEQLDRLRTLFASACTSLGAASDARGEALEADALLDDADDPCVVLRDAERLEPCGQANPTPRVALEGALVRSAREVKGGHLQLEVQTGSHALRCFGIDLGPLAPEEGARVHVLGKLRHDTYRGAGAAELMIEGMEKC